MSRLIAFVAAMALFAVGARGADESPQWPRFRGPNGSGVADAQKPPVEFGPDKNVKWKIPVPGGVSSPIVAGDLLIITAFDGGKLFTIAYSRADGTEAWRAEAPAKEIEKQMDADKDGSLSKPEAEKTDLKDFFDNQELIQSKSSSRSSAGEVVSGIASGGEGSRFIQAR